MIFITCGVCTSEFAYCLRWTCNPQIDILLWSKAACFSGQSQAQRGEDFAPLTVHSPGWSGTKRHIACFSSHAGNHSALRNLPKLVPFLSDLTLWWWLNSFKHHAWRTSVPPSARSKAVICLTEKTDDFGELHPGQDIAVVVVSSTSMRPHHVSHLVSLHRNLSKTRLAIGHMRRKP